MLEDNDTTIHLADSTSERDALTTNAELTGLVAFVRERFDRSRTARYTDETRWLKAYRNFRGLYGPDVQFTETEKSKVFVKITKTKVLAAYGQVIEVLFASGKFPIGIEPTKVPEGIAEYAHVDTQAPPEETPEEPQDIYGYAGDGKELPKGATIRDLLGSLAEKLKGRKVEEGPGLLPTHVTVEPAAEAARKMEKTIHDQLDESQATTHLRHAIFESVLLGAGIVKGPFTTSKNYHRWTKGEDGKGVYAPLVKDVPEISAVSCWNYYNDPDATNISDSEYGIERHCLNRSQLRDLKNRPFFREDEIESVIEDGPDYTKEWWEDIISDSQTSSFKSDRWEVLEYWGVIDRDIAEEAGLELPDAYKMVKQVQVNAWICGTKILRLVMNPFKPSRLPYLVFPYEINPYAFWGIGVPENMEDSQMIMNGHARMAIDNLALAGNLVLEVDETNLVPGQDMRIYAGKIFRRQGGQPGQAIFGIKFPNTAPENMAIFDKFRQLADESTGIPSYSHGQTGVNSTTRTASGMSMLMGASALNIKTVVKNLDDFLLRPLGEGMFHWNMQFSTDDSIKGDLDVQARGTSSLMQKEVRSQRLMMFMQTASNPATAAHVKWPTLLKEIAIALDIDPEKFINSPDEAMLQAQLMKGMGNGMEQGGGPASPGGPQAGLGMGGPPGMGGPQKAVDPTGSGAGTIGTGIAPMPGEAGFSASV